MFYLLTVLLALASLLPAQDSLSVPRLPQSEARPLGVPEAAVSAGMDDEADTALIIEREAFTPASAEESSSQSIPGDSLQEKLNLKSGEEISRTFSRKTAFYSLLMPGLGEYLSGKHKLGRTAMIIDGLMWVGLGSAFYVRSQIRDDLRAYLFTYGDADGRHGDGTRTAWDLSDEELELPLYADSSGFYEWRVYAPSRDPYMLKIDFFWQWESEAAHQRYYDLWSSANRAKVAAYYFLGASVVLRVASFVNASRIIKKANLEHTEAEQPPAVLFYPVVMGRAAPGLALSARF